MSAMSPSPFIKVTTHDTRGAGLRQARAQHPDTPRAYTVSAVRVHAPAVEQQLEERRVPLPRGPERGVGQRRFLLGG